jgi:hypothetical protein
MPTLTRKVSYNLGYRLVSDSSNGTASVENHYSTTVVSNSFTGDRVPNYKYLIANGFSATSVATGEQRDITSSEFTQYIKGKVGSGWESHKTIGHVDTEYLYEVSTSPDSSFDSSIVNKALSNFLRNAKSKQRQFQSGVFIGELRETIHLIRNPLSGIRKLVNDYVGRCRSARGLSPRSQLRHLANQWLEFQFGVLPLVSDVSSGCEAIKRLRNKRYLAPVRSLVEGDKPLTSESFIIDPGWSGRRRIERYTSYHISRSLTGAVYCKSQGGPDEYRQSLGLTLSDFIPTVYELIPYSFLVDYFTNLGEFIDAWSFCQGDLAWHSDTTRRVGTCEVRSIPVKPGTYFGNPIQDYYAVPSKSTYKLKTFSRGAPILGLPSLGFRIPGTSTKFLNVAALASLRVL